VTAQHCFFVVFVRGVVVRSWTSDSEVTGLGPTRTAVVW